MAKLSHNEIKFKAVQWSDSSTSEPGRLYQSGDKYRTYNGRRHYDLGEIQVFEMYDDLGSFPATGIQGVLYYTRITGEVYTWNNTVYKKVGNVSDGAERVTSLVNYRPDVSQTNYFEYIMTNDSSIVAPSSFEFGKTGTIVVTMDATGGHTITWDSIYNFVGGAVALDTSANAVNIFKYTIQGMNSVVMEELQSYVPNPYFALKFTTNGNVIFTASDDFEFASIISNSWTAQAAGTWQPNNGTYVIRKTDAAMTSFKVTGGAPGLTTDIAIEGIGTVDAADMFNGCTNITSADLTRFRMNSVTAMDQMFDGCAALTCITNIDTTTRGDVGTIFTGCTALVRPNAAEVTLIETPPGTNWTNTQTCP